MNLSQLISLQKVSLMGLKSLGPHDDPLIFGYIDNDGIAHPLVPFGVSANSQASANPHRSQITMGLGTKLEAVVARPKEDPVWVRFGGIGQNSALDIFLSSTGKSVVSLGSNDRSAGILDASWPLRVQVQTTGTHVTVPRQFFGAHMLPLVLDLRGHIEHLELRASCDTFDTADVQLISNISIRSTEETSVRRVIFETRSGQLINCNVALELDGDFGDRDLHLQLPHELVISNWNFRARITPADVSGDCPIQLTSGAFSST